MSMKARLLGSTPARVRAGIAFAAAWGGLAAIALLTQPGPLAALQMRVGDMLFVQEGGPMLGMNHTPRDDIVVLHDTGGVAGAYSSREVAADFALYQRLLEDGAVAVSDLRYRGPGKEADELMQGLVAFEPKGLVLRQFDNRVAERSGARAVHSAASPYWFDSPRDLANNIRYYVLLSRHPGGYRETAALRLARAFLRLEAPARPEELQTSQGYWFGDGLTLPMVHRPSQGAPDYLGEHVMQIDYTGAPGAFPAFSIGEAEQGGMGAGFFRGKLVIIDSGELGAQGTPTSVARPMTEGELDANVVQSILNRDFLHPQPVAVAVAVTLLLTLAAGALFGRLRPEAALPVLAVLLAGYLASAVLQYRAGTVGDVFFTPIALLGTFLSTSVYGYLAEERARQREEAEKRRIRETFGRYLAQPVVEKLLRDPKAVALGGQRQLVTVLFADIRGYTTYSEQNSPEEIVSTLNGYLSLATRGILAQEGTVDKYIGDAIMAYFNAPLAQEDHALRAVRAAMAIQDAMGTAAGDPSAELRERPGCGIGVHTGMAIVGNVGSPELMSYTVIGDAVNVASRLQSNAQPGEILLSEAAYDHVRGQVEVEPLEPLQVKGRTAPVGVYRVVGLRVGTGGERAAEGVAGVA